ncbi:MAG: sulfatase-like hydrolase/transferase [Armatimonadia bacterium]|nr:sulfatase-like hydrolase/transferase [Armatimonadia bacterium]
MELDMVSRRDFMRRSALLGAGLVGGAAMGAPRAGRPPNIVVIFADDLGYGDLSCLGHPTLHTPNLDRMAAEGMKLTQFYSAHSVCTPSRAALMTGRLPVRNGMCGNRRVLFPNSGGGLPTDEVTIASMLRPQGCQTACVGKWHLGHRRRFLPTSHGFDRYYGIPYSNDMRPCPILENETVVEEPANQDTLTARYTARCVDFIQDAGDDPFFLYYAQTFPHVPLFASRAFEETSLRGLYGDVVEELDWSVGVILDTLRRRGLAENTLVVFTSDNGPWLVMNERGGSAGLLRGGKGSTWEGGMREPAIAWWPGTIEAGSLSAEMSSTLDVLPTCAEISGAPLPEAKTLDGTSLMPILRGGEGSRSEMPYYRNDNLWAYRKGPWKIHYQTQMGYRSDHEDHDPPLLYHLEHDPSERLELGERRPDIRDEVDAAAQAHLAGVEKGEPQLGIPLPEGAKPGQIDV